MLHTTLMLLKKDGKLLLGLKKRGFGLGKLNGVGGKLEKGETIDECVVRETFEEIGVRVTEMEHMADIVFDDLYYKGVPERNIMHVYISTKWTGKPTETDEIKPEWVSIAKIPYEKMWCDDPIWLPEILRGRHIDAWFHFNEKNVFTDHWVSEWPMNCISDVDDKRMGLTDTGEDRANFPVKEGARAVLLNKKGQVALIHAKNRGWYKIPGGGREDGELILENLRREVIEETGYTIKNIQPLGYAINYRSQWQMIGKAYMYICHTDKFVGKEPMPDEIKDGDELEWFDSIDEALAALKAVDLKKIDYYGAYFFTQREIDTLEYARQFLKEKHGR